jgi:hypothetical protein
MHSRVDLILVVFPRFQCSSRDRSNSLAFSRRHLAVFSPKSSACNYQIGQAKERVKPCGVLGKPTVANLLQTQQVLDDVERMLDLSPNARFVILDFLQDSAQPLIGQCAAFIRAHRNMPVRPFLLSPMALFNTPITRIAKGISFFTVQQLIRYRDIGGVGRRRHQSVRKTRLSIHPDVRLHPKVPRVTFFGLVHRPVTGAIAVLGGRGCGNNRCIHHRTASHHQPLGGQVLVDRLKDAHSQLMFFEQAAKLQQRRCIRCAFASEIHTDKAANRLAVVQRIFIRLILKPKGLLCDVHAQDLLKTDRRASAAFFFGIERFKLSHKERPRRYSFDLSEKAIASRQALFGVIIKIREACLHGSSPRDRYNIYCTSASISLDGVEPNKSVIIYQVNMNIFS